ncbi:MAG TPA: NADH-quinone oxidoreductase subunit N [Sandaracinaceae bacterium]
MTTFEFTDLFAIAPLLLVTLGGLGMMLADAFVKSKAELGLVTAVILFGASAVSLGMWFSAPETVPEWVSAYLSPDPLAHFLDLVICGGAGVAALLAGGYLREHAIERGEFYVVLLFTTVGAMALARAVDLLTLFVAIETLSLGSYGLVAYRRHSPRAAEGALKYFLLGSFASAILLFGSALLYGATGHTNLVRIGSAVPAIVSEGGGPVVLLSLATLLIVVGLAFKVSAVPFHAWTPDAYEGAVTPVTTFMAVVVKAAVFGVMLRVLFTALGDGSLASPDSGWPPALAALSAFTMIFGNLAAIVQKSVKRMLAYSSISHAGYILLGVVAAWKMGDRVGVGAVLFYLAAYAASNLLAFGSLILAGSRGKEAVSYEDLAGLGRRHPLVALPFALGVLSLMGFPPLAGFFGKYYVILAAVNAGGGLVWLAVIAVVTSAIGAYYYLRVTVFLFMKQPEEGAPIAVPMRSGYVAAALTLASYAVLRLGVTPDAYLALVGATRGEPPDPWVFVLDGAVALVLAAVAAALATREASEAEEAERPAPAHSS